MRLLAFLLLFAAAVSGDSPTFVSPGPSFSNVNPSVSNAIHPLGSNFYVAWSGTNASQIVSIVLFQYDGTDLQYPFEYVKQSVPTGETSLTWVVATDKDLSFSNLFLLNLFYDGETAPVAVSETFNITDPSSSSSTTSSTSSSSTLSTSTLLSSTTSSVTSTTSSSTTSPTTSETSAAPAATAGAVVNQSSDMSTGVKAGIGIGAAAVALGGIALGYLLFRHIAKKQQYVAPVPEQIPVEQKPVYYNLGSTYGPPTYELNGLDRPSELGSAPTMHELSGDGSRH